MTTNGQDHYAILGVAPTATPAQVSHAYRALLRRLHPDTRDATGEPQGQLADGALRRVLAAYAVLADPARRAAYDGERSAARAQPPVAPPRQPTGPRSHPPQPPIVAGPVRWHRQPGSSGTGASRRADR